MVKKIFLSIIIPSFNEEENFKKKALIKVVQYLKNFPYSHEVILVDDGSTDKTTFLLKKFIKGRKGWRIVQRPHFGKAATIKAGVENAQGENVLFTDFDQATPLAEIEKLTPFLKKGYQIVIGSREVRGAKRQKEPFYRHLMGKGFNIIVQAFALPGIHDTQCGFKIFNTKVARELFHKLRISHIDTKRAFTGAFDVELLYLAQKKGYRIAEVPVYWQHFKTTRVNPIRDSLRMFFDVLKIRLYDLLGKYE